ncbi:MAG: flavin reductase family protein [Gammaproteobacteria bacterium]|nr:flavin reductase family protein [Gammaproteobacteria bacterium]
MTQKRPSKPEDSAAAGQADTDTLGYRRALSLFATGVSVVTALDSEGNPVGITVSSFNSVSLDPPLVLWSVGLESMSYEAFTSADHFAVHVLGKGQEDLCDHFAKRVPDKFGGLDWGSGFGGAPILPDFAACFECSTEHVYPGGDHQIVVGRVHRFEYRDSEPLIIYQSRFLT